MTSVLWRNRWARVWLASTSLLLTAAIFVADVRLVSHGLAIEMTYAVVVLIVGLWWPAEEHAMIAAAVCSVLVVVRAAVSWSIREEQIALVDRPLSIALVWVIAVLVMRFRRASAQNARLAAIVESSGDAIIAETLEGIITSWNEAAERLYGYASVDARGRSISLIVPRDRADEPFDMLNRVRQGEQVQFETERLRRDGTQVPVSVTMSPVADPAGRITGASAVARDVTALRRTEDALHKAEAELARISRALTMGELATLIAHEVNQPLAAIVNDGGACLRWLAAEPPNLDEARESVRQMIADGNRASDVVARIRAFVTATPSVNVAFDVNELIRETGALLHREMARLNVMLRADLTARLPRVLGDRVQVQQVLLNLMVNALDAMSTVQDRPRELSVRSAQDGPAGVRVAVRDSGVGIDPKVVDRIFEAFYTTKAGGLGMGLPICRSIIEKLGGRLWAEAHEGPGATVQFTLRMADEEIP